MNKRTAKKLAYQIAFAAVVAMVDAGAALDATDNDEDAEKVQSALEAISDSLFKRCETQPE